ncbi:LacI family DNA-binding transcriptional regulator [Neomicrococcus lactis]
MTGSQGLLGVKDIARLASVSSATVSRVLQGTTRVSDETRTRVEKVMAEVGYVPNALASAMRTRRTGIIGVVTGQLTNPWYPLMLETLAKNLAEQDLSMNVWVSDGEVTDESAINAIRSRAIDGVIFLTALRNSKALPAALEYGLPLVLVNRKIDDVESDHVVSDNIAGGRSVAQYFLKHGRTNVAVIGGWATVSTGRDRRQGFISEFAKAGIELDKEQAPTTEFSYSAGLHFGRTILRDKKPQAVFCTTDVIAFGVMDAAKELGLRVPEDLWVVGYDDIPMASWGALNLTSVRQSMDMMATTALELLMSRIANPNSPFVQQVFDTELIVRNSTGFAPIS